jgi:hypothetical protein
MNKRVLFLTVALVGMSFSAYAAETSSSAPLTVDAAVQEALRDSPTIQSSEAAVSESSWHKFQMIGNGFLPKLSDLITSSARVTKLPRLISVALYSIFQAPTRRTF